MVFNFVFPGFGVSSAIKVEPGLFEWLGTGKQSGPPKFMSPEELKETGYSVDPSHPPIWSFDRLLANLDETVEQFYERSYMVTKEILKRHEGEGCFALFCFLCFDFNSYFVFVYFLSCDNYNCNQWLSINQQDFFIIITAFHCNYNTVAELNLFFFWSNWAFL